MNNKFLMKLTFLFQILHIEKRTWKVANMDPLNQRLLCRSNPVNDIGGSVRHLAPAT